MKGWLESGVERPLPYGRPARAIWTVAQLADLGSLHYCAVIPFHMHNN